MGKTPHSAQSTMSDCKKLHTPEPGHPSDYTGWHEWAEKMGKTHVQKRCPKCGLWKIWIPKRKKREKSDE